MSTRESSPPTEPDAPPPAAGLALLLRVFGAVASLYAFMVGIGAMGSAFKWMGSDYTNELLGGAHGPIVSLFIGILATTLVQSSSSTSSLAVGLVAAGGLPLDSAIFMVMGANVGTTVTNTIVSLGHIGQTTEYRRAFAAASVHDFFNILVLLVLFPLEWGTGLLDVMAEHLTQSFQNLGGMVLADPVKALTMPAIEGLQRGVESSGLGAPTMAVAGIAIMFGGLIALVKLLRSIMVTRLSGLFDDVLFATPVRSMVFGLVLTVLVQSSSITTSLVVPLVGAGVLTIAQAFPYTMGANVGTTATALLASLGAFAAAAPEDQPTAILGLTLAFHHVLFNVIGVALLWPIRSFPIFLAEQFARLAQWNRAVPMVYILVMFYLLPLAVVWLGD